ncbi:SLIT and NTRK-like protein 3 [Lates japonicus]|uniref:SLIT and NTRK-like protein 3 n=1 Tax=Lates japonicus TaxID=270547 RepID=A0AAD3RP48_LATJO|nr:SLIT and NTRK-like protein 3 [Lates japonicus]
MYLGVGWLAAPQSVDNSEEEVDEPCFEPCTCEVKEGVLHVHCDGRGFTTVSQLTIPLYSSSCTRSVSLTHLDPREPPEEPGRAGTLSTPPVASPMEIQLEENPWNCGCRRSSSRAGPIPTHGRDAREYPFHLHGQGPEEIPRKEAKADLVGYELRQGEAGGPRDREPLKTSPLT